VFSIFVIAVVLTAAACQLA